MTTEIYLDPEQTAEMEPFELEQEGRVRSGISPFAVPRGAFVEGPQPGLVERVIFDYAGGEKPTASELLDEMVDPAVMLSTALHTRKIIILEISHPVDVDGLKAISKRLLDRAPVITPKAKQFSFMMIARVLEKWADRIASVSELMGH
ncbi:MAG: hypothetical protein NVSMB9_23190 [Isosphaeraceae bacterium]